MIECIPTIDYEIYGNGEGSLKDLIIEPTERLITICHKYQARFVIFVEVAELEIIEAAGTDSAISLVKEQIKQLYEQGFEIGLHLHPQWYNARYNQAKWSLDYGEYNLCNLTRERIAQVVGRSIDYLRKMIGAINYTPLAFRAGNWLFQPTQVVAEVLAERGVKVDSSVFKGGVQHQHRLDYRRALGNGYYWRFTDQVDIADPNGILVEFPIYTQMVPIWEMVSAKRVGLQQRSLSKIRTSKQKANRLLDLLRFKQPLKLDFCRMKMNEITRMFGPLEREDQKNPAAYKPIVAIGHTKELFDYETLDSFLSYLRQKGIAISTLEEAYRNVICE